MDIFNVLNLIGGLCLFLFGMNLMGQALERRAGGKLRSLLGKMTGRKLAGFAEGKKEPLSRKILGKAAPISQ